MRKIPKHIRKKLLSIYNHQYAAKIIIQEIMIWAGLDYDDIDKEKGWDWGMFIDIQGQVMEPVDSALLLQEYMNNKV